MSIIEMISYNNLIFLKIYAFKKFVKSVKKTKSQWMGSNILVKAWESP